MKNFTPSQNCLQGKIIAVTGAGSGIGSEIAKAFASFGATVVLLGRTVTKLETVYDEIEANNDPQPAIIPIDFETADTAQYENIHFNIEKEFGRLDALVHNAAELGERTSIASYTLKVWQQLMAVNVNAPFALTKYLLPLLKNSDSGSVVFTGSSVGRKGKAYWGAYAASKAATENLMQTLADELEETSKVRVNSINPGATRTPMRALAYPAEDPATIKHPNELIPVYTYLVSDASCDVTGQQFSG